MRIVGGRHRGRRLVTPKDNKVRPTSDRVREALFNVLAHGDPPLPRDATVLDLFAGTGAFGLEALSRGASHVTFVDNSPSSLRLVRENIDYLKEANQATVLKADAVALPPAKSPVGLLFADPPYGKGLVGPALASALAQGWIDADTVILVETGPEDLSDTPPPLRQERDWQYGETRIYRFSLEP